MLLKILPISSYSNGAACNRPSKPVFGASYVNYGGVGVIDAPMDTFAISKKGSGIKAVRFYRIPTAKCPANRKFTLEDYKNLSESEKGFIMANIPDRTKGLASVNVKIGMAIKQTFDDTYGEGNYKFISLGTSPACAAKVLELMGADVIYLPMSYAHSTCAKPWLESSPYIEFYKEFMHKKGLSNEALKKEGKRGIICDYAISGRSLELSEYMLKGPLGLDESLLDTYTMNSLIQNSEYIPDDVKDKYLNDLLKNEKAANYCDVPHFSFIDKRPFSRGIIKDTKSLTDYFETYRAKSSNAYNFCVMSILDKEGKLNGLAS